MSPAPTAVSRGRKRRTTAYPGSLIRSVPGGPPSPGSEEPRRGFDADADVTPPDLLADESPALAGISSASIQGRVALGRRAGARAWRVGEEPDAPWVVSSAPRHAHLGRGAYYECVIQAK